MLYCISCKDKNASFTSHSASYQRYLDKNNTFKFIIMKKAIILLCALVLSIAAANAQSMQEILKDSPELTKLFVYPFGITKPFGEMTAAEMTTQLDSLKVEYTTRDLGVLGTTFDINSSDMKIGGVPVAMAGMTVGPDMSMMIYTSTAADNYEDFANALMPELSKLQKIDPSSMTVPMPTPEGVEIYSAGPTCGIGVGAVPNSKTALAIMTDIKNASGLVNMFGATPQQ